MNENTPDRALARLLLVEDEELLRRAMEHGLRSLGHEPTACADASEALAVFKDRPQEFDAVVTDFWMPDGNGVELALAILAFRRLPVLLLSAYCEDWPLERVRSVGIHTLLHKPVSIVDLDKAVRAALARAP